MNYEYMFAVSHVYNLLEDQDVLICCDMFRLNQVNVWVPYTTHIHLQVLLVRRTLSL